MITTIENYGRQGTPSTGRKVSQTLDAATIVGEFGTYVIDMGRDYRNRPHTSLLIDHRATAGSYVAHVHLFGCGRDGHKERDWFGPFEVVTISSTELAAANGTANCRLVKNIDGTDWKCGPTKQVDTQDWPMVAALLTIESTSDGFAGGSGIMLDVHIQYSTA